MKVCFSPNQFFRGRCLVDPFRAPEPLPILNPSDFVPKNGFPVVKGLSSESEGPNKKKYVVRRYRGTRRQAMQTEEDSAGKSPSAVVGVCIFLSQKCFRPTAEIPR